MLRAPRQRAYFARRQQHEEQKRAVVSEWICSIVSNPRPLMPIWLVASAVFSFFRSFCAHPPPSRRLVPLFRLLSDLSTVSFGALANMPQHNRTTSYCSSFLSSFCFLLFRFWAATLCLLCHWSPNHPRMAKFSTLVGCCANTSGPLTHPCST